MRGTYNKIVVLINENVLLDVLLAVSHFSIAGCENEKNLEAGEQSGEVEERGDVKVDKVKGE
ncbi:hypothetical protein ACIQYS_10345 [Psychrobacillus sp. NPDC096426]|uniref:hypothetical protein n=1 Tax=Psychrobacillus sp. NPDC096426 TaxID=3364491 RepID=UPI003802360F